MDCQTGKGPPPCIWTFVASVVCWCTYSILNDSLHHPYICECFCRKPYIYIYIYMSVCKCIAQDCAHLTQVLLRRPLCIGTQAAVRRTTLRSRPFIRYGRQRQFSVFLSLLLLHIIHVSCHIHHLAYCMYSHFPPIPSLLLLIYQIHKLLHD